MKFYFYSKIAACLKINGKYEGRVSKNVNLTAVDDCADALFEFLPLNPEYHVCYGVAGSEKIAAYDFLDGLLLCPEYEKRRDRPYKVLSLDKFYLGGEVYVKTYFDGGIMYDIDCERYIRGELPLVPKRAEAIDAGGYKAFLFTGEKTCAVVYSDTGNAVFCDVADGFSFRGGEVQAEKRLINSTIPFVLRETYAAGEPFNLTSRETEFLKSPFLINENLSDYAVLDLILKKADVSKFLHPDLKKNAEALYSFLGGVKGAFCFSDGGNTKTAVIEKDKVSYINFEKSNNLITNISLT